MYIYLCVINVQMFFLFYSVDVDFVWGTLNDWRFSLTKRWLRRSSACKDDVGLAEKAHNLFDIKS